MKFKNAAVAGSWAGRRKEAGPSVIVSDEHLVRACFLTEGQELPRVLEATIAGVDLATWAANYPEEIEENVLKYGAVLFRNFEVHSARDLERAIEATSQGALEYKERSSPRSTVEGHIYTSTDYPPTFDIFPHNEHSYSLTFPLRLYFCCLVAAKEGGETPIADTRRILNRISPAVRKKFAETGWMYVRNFGEGFGLPWQTTFQTDDPAVVERYCREKNIECKWGANGTLRTSQVRPAMAKHPRTGDLLWFNHATFFHISTLHSDLRNGLLAQFKPEELPNNTYYGDGSEIEPEVLEELRLAYLAESIANPWQPGDVLLIDNMLTAHARKAFKGERKVLVGMAEPHTRTDITF
jgi:alpha-ketoglutarate-dependent taurine dioxygenase